MIYQLRANLYFETNPPCEAIKNAILAQFHSSKVINPGTSEQEISILEVIECHHDLAPNEPCTLLFRKEADEQPPS